MPSPDDVLAEQGAVLADAIEACLPRWAERVVVERGGPPGAGLVAGTEAATELLPEIRHLLAADVDEQRANPLALLRRAVAWPTRVLRDAGVPPVARDEHARTHFPEDLYDLTPMTFADVDPSLHEVGLLWGATKAHVHLRRHAS
jgi:hypothetical protein